MFICDDCGEVFEEPAAYYESREFWGASCQEAFGACPNCGSTDYDVAMRCDRCGEWVIDGHWTDIFLCDICFDDLYGGSDEF